MYQALYRTYRQQTFWDVVGQQGVTDKLRSDLETGRLSHAYLFTGTRGTGKTSCAKILAKAVNCENLQDGNPCNACPSCRAIDSGGCMDVLEIDAASNNGVDSVRVLRDEDVYKRQAWRFHIPLRAACQKPPAPRPQWPPFRRASGCPAPPCRSGRARRTRRSRRAPLRADVYKRQPRVVQPCHGPKS